MHIPLLILLFFIADLVALAMLGSRIHFLPTVAFLVLGLVIGSALLRRAFIPAREAVHRSKSGEPAGNSVPTGDALVVGLAGLLFSQPGPLSDILALLLLLPLRGWARRRLLGLVNASGNPIEATRHHSGTAEQASSTSSQTVDAVSVRTVRKP